MYLTHGGVGGRSYSFDLFFCPVQIRVWFGCTFCPQTCKIYQTINRKPPTTWRESLCLLLFMSRRKHIMTKMASSSAFQMFFARDKVIFILYSLSFNFRQLRLFVWKYRTKVLSLIEVSPFIWSRIGCCSRIVEIKPDFKVTHNSSCYTILALCINMLHLFQVCHKSSMILILLTEIKIRLIF